MAHAVMIPKLGNTVEECIIGSWKKQPGEAVAAGEILLEIETDKTVFEVEAPAAGILLEVFFRSGDLVPVLTNIAVIGAAGEDAAPFRPQLPPPQAAGAAAPPAKEQPAAALSGGMAGQQPAMAQQLPQPTQLPVQPPAVQPTAQPAAAGGISPRARRFAAEHGLPAAGLRGSGPGGRILERDLLQPFRSGPRVSCLARTLIAEGWSPRGEGSGLNGLLTRADLREPGRKLSTIRSTIARRMHDSLATTAQFTIACSARADGLLALRSRLKELAKTGSLPNITINDLVMFVLVKTLCEFPALNAEYIGEKVHEAADINLAFACDTPRGLVVPVVKQAQRLSLPQLAVAVKGLSLRAVSGALESSELSGGTFTSTNIGHLGIESFTPIINTPQVAILGVCAINLKPVKTARGVEFIEHIGLCLTVNHQVVDGAPAARFLGALKTGLENFETDAEWPD